MPPPPTSPTIYPGRGLGFRQVRGQEMGQAAEVMCTDIAALNEWGVRPMVALRIADCERVVPKRASASLSAYVIVDRAWAQALGVPGLRGAHRVGKFYRLPRAEYRMLVAAHFCID
jgi:hypothetical protein